MRFKCKSRWFNTTNKSKFRNNVMMHIGCHECTEKCEENTNDKACDKPDQDFVETVEFEIQERSHCESNVYKGNDDATRDVQKRMPLHFVTENPEPYVESGHEHDNGSLLTCLRCDPRGTHCVVVDSHWQDEADQVDCILVRSHPESDQHVEHVPAREPQNEIEDVG